MKLLTSSVVLFLAASTLANSGKKITKEEYVEKWSVVAVEQMALFDIPASITLAQGILESASGNSKLAIQGKNHFGIKCHGWEGLEMYHDDDKKKECFRVYSTVEDSYVDHSEFLKKRSRYAFLFDFNKTDYKAWARGLKKAGYATNPKYPQLLINIIEDLGLDKYDKSSRPDIHKKPEILELKKVNPIKVKESRALNLKKTFEQQMNTHTIKEHRKGVKYVVSKKGDTFYKISKEFGLKLSQLYRYNDFNSNKDVLEEGDIVFIQPKKRARLFKKEVITLTRSMSLIDVSQHNAINIKSVKRLNKISNSHEKLAIGERVTLR